MRATAVRTQYIKILLPYEEWKESTGEYRVKAEDEEEDDEETAERREREERAREEKEEKKRKKEERAALLAAENDARHTRRRPKDEGGAEEESVAFQTEAGVIVVGSKVSVFWDGDGVSYKGIVMQMCDQRGCMVVYDADGETHWEMPESIKLRYGGDGGDIRDEDMDEGDLPMLDSLGGQGALASLDTCLDAGDEVGDAVKSIVMPVKRETDDPSQGDGVVASGNGEICSSNRCGSVGMGRKRKKRKAVAESVVAGEGDGEGGDASVDGLATMKVEKVVEHSEIKSEEKMKTYGEVILANEGAAGGAVEGQENGKGTRGGSTRAGKIGRGKMGGGRARDVDEEAGSTKEERGVEEKDDDEYRFGYHDGNTYTLQGFRKMANEWKEAHFERTLKKTSEDDVEEEYWRIISTPETRVEVEYGSELHTTQHGSGFPTHGNALNPLDSKTTSTYCRSGWNLNNLNECTLLRFVKEDIPGIISPWLYMGMCFSSFCWHNEDHFLYSINYLWEGEPKQWYGVSGDQADLFEATIREYAPQLFELQPDVLFQLVTMIAPSVLKDKGVHVCRARQGAGEFMVTFPRAYHGGFNMGYNVAESCNFALTDWIPWGLMSDRWYRQLGRAQVFSHPGLLVSLAQNSDTVETAMWLLSDLERYFALEQQGVQALIAKGLTARRRLETTAGILTNMLSANAENEQANTMLDGKRLCAGRMKSSNMSMQDIRRQRESQGQDECCICLGSTFLFLVRCSCSDKRVSCVAHAHRMCSCPVTSKTLESRFSDDEITQLVSDVRQRAERPAIWTCQVDHFLGASARGDKPPHVRAVQRLVAEAEAFPRALTFVWQRQEELKNVLKQGNTWATQSKAIMAAVKKSEPKGRAAAKETNTEPSTSIADIQKLIEEASELKAVPDELEVLEALMASVMAWRERIREVLPDHVRWCVELRKLDDAFLRQLLVDGRLLRVQIPELRKLAYESDLRAWISSLPDIPGCCALARAVELVKDADDKKLQSPEVDTVRRAMVVAETTRSRVQKARGRGTSVAVLRSLLEDIVKDKTHAHDGLIVELEEEQDIRRMLKKCDEWSDRVTLSLSEGDVAVAGAGEEQIEKGQSRRPMLKDLEQLQDDYQSIGVYIEVGESLRRRIETGQLWKRKVMRAAPLALAPPHSASAAPKNTASGLEEIMSGVEAAVRAAAMEGASIATVNAAMAAAVSFADTAAAMARAVAAAVAEEAMGKGEQDELELQPVVGSKRNMSKRDRERESKKMRRSDGGSACAGGVRSATSVTVQQVQELLEEEAKLRVQVEEAVTLRSLLAVYMQWCQDTRALLSAVGSPIEAYQFSQLDPKIPSYFQNIRHGTLLSAALQRGEAMGVVLGEEAHMIHVWLWGVKVGQLLAAGTSTYGAQVTFSEFHRGCERVFFSP